MNITHILRILRIGTTIVLLCAATSLRSAIIRYEAALGSLPSDQGFLVYQSTLDGSWQQPVVANGVLHQLPTTGLTYQWWYYTNAPIDFATTSYALEWRMRVIDSNYVPESSGEPRLGYYVQIIDGQGRLFMVGISNERIHLNNDAGATAANATVLTPFDSRDGFHTYRLEIGNGNGTLFIDGVSRISKPVGGAVVPGSPDQVAFGDGSWNGISETELQYLSLAHAPTPPPQLTIEVSQVRLCWTTLTNRIHRLQYQSALTGGGWTDLATNLIGTGSLFCTNDAVNAAQPQRFYRVVVDP